MSDAVLEIEKSARLFPKAGSMKASRPSTKARTWTSPPTFAAGIAELIQLMSLKL
jgi:hypothetical protein